MTAQTDSRRVEAVARALYREWMAEDYDDFPWDDENTPSNETEEEARHLASLAVETLDAHDEASDLREENAALRRLLECAMDPRKSWTPGIYNTAKDLLDV